MSRLYLELIEIVAGEDQSNADNIRVDVTDFTQQDYDATLANLRTQSAQYADFILRQHTCHHTDEPRKPCEVVSL